MSSARAPKPAASTAQSTMAGVVITAFVVAALYLGREMLIPLALAALLSFLLSPVVTRLERWLGRVTATVLAVAILFGVVGAVGWVLTRQVVDLATRLPDYQQNIQTKLRGLRMPGSGRFQAFNKAVEAIQRDLPGAEPTPAGTAPKTVTVVVPLKPGTGELTKVPASPAIPTPVEVVETRRLGPLQQLGVVLGSLAGPFGTGALVLLLLFCMLLRREDLRGRLIRLLGSGNISAATRGLDDAATRVSRYLLMQLIVNAGYGVVIFVGLYLIGVPSAFVWGVLAAVLRFIPYVGAWVSSGFPIALSLAASSDWTMPVLTVGLFLVVELVCNNVMEPLIYGSSTGVSSIALILAAVFWTWIWGPPGLVLATPLTVCLVVMGRHVPRLSILSVLLSDDAALAPHEEFYHRLLNPNVLVATDFAAERLKTYPLAALYDSVFLPALTTVERDQSRGQLEEEQHADLLQRLRDLVENLGRPPATAPPQAATGRAVGMVNAGAPPAPPLSTCRVTCLPVLAERDEVPGLMLARLLREHGFPAACLGAKGNPDDLLEEIGRDGAEVVCVSVVAPSTVVHARQLCVKLRAWFPRLHVIVGLWGATEQLPETTGRLREAGADEVVSTLADALSRCAAFAAELARETVPTTPLPHHESERLTELRKLRLLDTEADPVFDRLTSKLARVLKVPIALVTFVDQDRQFFKSQQGLPADLAQSRQTPRDVSVCSHVVAADELMVIEDLARDRRFAQNTLLNDRGLRFYAGAPLRGKDGHVLGSLCVLDHQPRRFGEQEKWFLQLMAEEVMEAVNERSLVEV